MNPHLIIPFILLSFPFCAQQIASTLIDSLFIDFYDNADYKTTIGLSDSRQTLESKPYFKKSYDHFKDAKGWNVLASVTGEYIGTWSGAEEYGEGVHIGKESMSLINNNCQPFPNKFCDIFHQLGILFDLGHETDKTSKWI